MRRAEMVREGVEAAHPALRRRREAYEEMALKVHAFMDVPAYLPVRRHTKGELALMHELKLRANLKEHCRWLSLIHTFQTQAPATPVPILYHYNLEPLT